MKRAPKESQPNRTKRTRDKDATRNKAIKAAMRVFVANGAERTTFTEIAKKAGLPIALLHYHFPKFEDLLAEVFLQVLEKIRLEVVPPTLNAQSKVDEALLDYLESHWRWALKNPCENSIWLYFYYAASAQKRFRELNDRVREAGRSRVALLIFQGLERRAFKLPPDRDVESVAEEIQAITIGTWVVVGTENKLDWEPLISSSRATIARLVGVMVGGQGKK